MVRVDNCEIVENSLGRWNPADLAYVEKICLESWQDSSTSLLIIVGIMMNGDVKSAKKGWPSKDIPSFRVELHFHGVRDLLVKAGGSVPIQLMGFYIEDIADRQLENCRYKVGDDENGSIGFYCEDVSVRSIAPISQSSRSKLS